MGKARQSRGNSLGLSSLNNSSKFGGLGVSLVVWYLAWPQVDLGQGKYWLGRWELDKRLLDSASVGLCMKSTWN